MRLSGSERPAAEGRGASAVEYAMLVALVAGVIIAAVIAMSPLVQDLYVRVTQGW